MVFDSLKAAILALNAAGERGFEGLVKVALSATTGLDFRLSESGLQGGIDGDSAHVSFECKLYTSKLNPDSVKSKIADLTRRKEIDLWVLCTTVPVRARLARELQELGAESGLEVQIVDWDDVSNVPRLAVLIAQIDGDILDEFLTGGGAVHAHVALARAELERFRASTGFASEASKLAKQLDVPYLGFEAARAANGRWLRQVLCDPQKARYGFGQPIAMKDEDGPGVRVLREALVRQITEHMSAAKSGGILALVGEEGVGKSWAPLDAWLRMDSPPMLLFVPAGKLAALGVAPDIQSVLEAFLPAQLDQSGLPHDRQRWHRTLGRWLQGSRPSSMVLIIDGINQHPEPDWGHLIGRLNHELKASRGRTIISSRTGFFDLSVKPRLAEPHVRLSVPEWTTDERDAILHAAGHNPAELNAEVGVSLQNPRLLSICLALLGEKTLRDLHEVSIPYLIFRHLEVIETDSPSPVDVRAVRDLLKRHAQMLAAATTPEQKEELRTIDDLDATKEGRFLRVVEDDTVRFELVNEGLTLAIGLALFDRVQRAISEGKNVGEEVARLIEPINAADQTVDVVLAAALVGDGRKSDDGEVAIAALLVAFIGLQNVSSKRLAVFVALCRKRPRSFMLAAEQVWLENVRQVDASWLESAVMQLRDEPYGWLVATGEIQRWLRYHVRNVSTAISPVEPKDVREERIENQIQKLAARLAALTRAEQGILSRLVDTHLNLPALFHLALRLMAGQPLAPFVPALADWAFGHHLNPQVFMPVFEVDWLGQFNTVDWENTRNAIHDHVSNYPDTSLSRTGLAVTAHLLRFTGDSDDAERAIAIQRHLNATNPEWPNVLHQSDSNPLDPSSVVARSARAEEIQRAVDVAGLYTSRQMTAEEHLQQKSLSTLVRSRPEIAIEKAREFIAHVLTRTGTPLRQGLLALDDVSLLMTPADARDLIALRRGGFREQAEDLDERDRRFLSWFLLLLAFPHLTGDEQLSALSDLAEDESVAVSLLPSFKSPSTSHAVAVIDHVLQKGSRERRLVAALIAESDMPLPANLGVLLDALLGTDDDILYGFLLLVAHGDTERLSEFAHSSWSADEHDDDGIQFFGSRILIKAVVRGLVPAAAIADRICVEAWGELAQSTPDGASEIALKLDDLVHRMAGIDVLRPVIDIELQDRTGHWPRRLPEISRPKRDGDADDLAAELGLEEKDYQARAEEDRQKLLRVETELAANRALALVRSLLPEDMAAIAKAEPQIVASWVPHFLDLAGNRKPLACTLALLVAGELVDADAHSALALIKCFGNVDPFTRVVTGLAGYSLPSRVAWAGLNAGFWMPVRQQRLLDADSDHALFLEARAAETAGNTSALLVLVDEFLSSALPSRQARGLTLLGFASGTEAARTRLERSEGTFGMAGLAHEYAEKSFEMNRWARHWFHRLVTVKDNEDAWCAQVLFLECVDARFEQWAPEVLQNAPGAWRFDGNIENSIRNKLNRQRTERMRRLFGAPRPRDEFLFPHRR